MSWLSGYGYRKQIDLSSASALTDYTVRLEIDTATLISNSKMLSDGADIRFTDDTGTTELPFWVNHDTINTATTEIYVKTSVDTNTTIYMYYGNSGATSSSNGKNTFVYYEDFENYVGADGTTPSDWNTYSGGDVQLYTDNGDRVALKTTQNDPNGGSVALGETLTDFEVVLHEKRINTTGGSRDRWSMGDSNANGVGWQYYATGNTTFELETRSSGSSQSLDTMTPANITHNQGEWYINKFTKLGTNYTAYAYDMVGNLLGTTTGTESTTYTFTHFYIHGGYEFLTDDIRIRKLVADEPTYTVNSEEVETVNTVNYNTDIGVIPTPILTISDTNGLIEIRW